MTTATRKKGAQIVKGRIDFVSLCPRGKNFMSTIYKSEDGVEAKAILLKGTAEQIEKGEVTGLVYVPLKKDADAEWAGPEVIKELAYSHARGGFQLDVQHDGSPLTKDQAFVAESFLVQKGDPRFADVQDVDGNPVDATGAWAMVVKLLDPHLKSLYRDGGWAGFSMGGSGVRKPGEPVRKEQEKNMTDEEIKALAKSISEGVVAGLTPVLKAQQQSTPPTQGQSEDDLVFKGDPTNLRQVRAHQAKLEKARLAKQAQEQVDWADPESVAAFAEGLEKAEEEAKLEKASAQAGDEDVDDDLSEVPVKFRKQAKVGYDMASRINKRRGLVAAE